MWAALLGAVDGFLFGCAAEFIRRAYNAYQERLSIEEFESVGLHAPHMMEMLRWQVIPITATICFMLVTVVIYRYWAVKWKSTLLLWQMIGGLSVICWSVLWEVLDWLGPGLQRMSWQRFMAKYVLEDELAVSLVDLIIALVLISVINLICGGLILLVRGLHKPNRTRESTS